MWKDIFPRVYLKMFVPLLLYQRVVLNCYRVPHVVFLKINTDHVTTTSNNTHTLTLWKCSFSENIHLAPNTPLCRWFLHWISMFSFFTLDCRYVGHLYCDKKPCIDIIIIMWQLVLKCWIIIVNTGERVISTRARGGQVTDLRQLITKIWSKYSSISQYWLQHHHCTGVTLDHSLLHSGGDTWTKCVHYSYCID